MPIGSKKEHCVYKSIARVKDKNQQNDSVLLVLLYLHLFFYCQPGHLCKVAVVDDF